MHNPAIYFYNEFKNIRRLLTILVIKKKQKKTEGKQTNAVKLNALIYFFLFV